MYFSKKGLCQVHRFAKWNPLSEYTVFYGEITGQIRNIFSYIKVTTDSVGTYVWWVLIIMECLPITSSSLIINYLSSKTYSVFWQIFRNVKQLRTEYRTITWLSFHFDFNSFSKFIFPFEFYLFFILFLWLKIIFFFSLIVNLVCLVG